MNTQKELVIGMFGFGVVGEGLYTILQRTPSLNARLKRACIKHPDKKRNAPATLFTSDKNDLLYDDEINVIVEVINDSKAAFEIVTTALKNGKAVVSASKKMISENLPALLALQKETGLPFLCEAAACASIPVIRNLEEYYDNDLLHAIHAIVNGSTNFILTKMFDEKLNFQDALLLAQQLGFAETDPTLDIDGFDAAHKWTILLTHAYGIVANIDHILFSGIQNIQLGDALFAKEKGWNIKLVAQATRLRNGKIAVYVLPQFVKNEDLLAFVKNEFNGVVIESGFAEKQFFYGKGAGSLATGSAVMSDISALRYGYKYEYKKLYHHKPKELTDDFYVRVYISFDEVKKIRREEFEWIEEWHAGLERSYLIGVIHFAKLKNHDWWKVPGVSLILMVDEIIEEIDSRNAKKRSLELAGIG